MLLILYGTMGELGKKCRDYIQTKGYELIEKYNRVDGEAIHKERFDKRKYVSDEEFLDRTDSIFRYNVANIQVGFNWEQISDAVYNNKNKLLTCSPTDVTMFRNIRKVYAKSVKIIYCYIDAGAMEGLNVALSQKEKMASAEYGSRMALGLSIKECYSKNADLFDSVIIYGGEGSLFNYATIYQQLDAILGDEKQNNNNETKTDNKHYDIFIFASKKDLVHSQTNQHAEFIEEVVASLVCRGIRVFNSWNDLRSGDDFYESIKTAISGSRVFLPIVSENSLKSAFFYEELKIAMQAAKNSALIIKPISLDGAHLPEWMREYSAYNVKSEHYQGSVNFVEDWFISMFSGEATLKNLSEEIDVCVRTGLYERAYELQGSYVTTLHNHLSMWQRNGTVEKVNAWIKFLDLSIQIQNIERSSQIINSLLSDITDDLDVGFYNNVARSIVEYCNVSNTPADNMYERFYKCLNISLANQQKFFEAFNILYELETRKHDNIKKDAVDITLANKIAAYSNASVELFEALFENGIAQGYRDALISAYNRIIDYCKTVSLGNSITEKCIDRVSELKSISGSGIDETEEGRKTLQSLKVYLGQALPDTGNYDVFISHKSADDMLADKVYDYLRNCGFEVFCDHHTLGELRDSNYDKRVMEALGKSKHLILVASSPDYVKDGWVHDEWHHFHSDKRDGYRNGNLIMILSDDLLPRKAELPIELRDGYEIIKTSEFRDKINNYLW